MMISEILEQNKKQIINEYLSGISTNKLGEIFNCNPGMIYIKLKKWGVKVKKKKNFKGDIDEYQTRILSLFQAGYSSAKISKRLKISKSTVLRVLHKYGCELECKVDYNNLLKNYTNKIILSYNAGKSTSKIAKELGYSQSCVWKLLNDNGLI